MEGLGVLTTQIENRLPRLDGPFGLSQALGFAPYICVFQSLELQFSRSNSAVAAGVSACGLPETPPDVVVDRTCLPDGLALGEAPTLVAPAACPDPDDGVGVTDALGVAEAPGLGDELGGGVDVADEA